MIDAQLSANRKAVLCGACSRELGRRRRLDTGDHWLVWDSTWTYRVSTASMPAHFVRAARPGRLERGESPHRRRPYLNYAELDRLARAGKPVQFPPLGYGTPFVCECGALNRLDPTALDVIA